MASANDNRVIIFDTTLRDGEQSPGASMTLDEKLRVAQALAELKVDVIEAGFAIASNGHFQSVHAHFSWNSTDIGHLMQERRRLAVAPQDLHQVDVSLAVFAIEIILAFPGFIWTFCKSLGLTL